MTYPDISRASWRKSSYSGGNGNCVEVADWRKSSFSAQNGNRIEAGSNDVAVTVRDSKDPHGPHLAFTPTVWRSFTASLTANA